MRQAVTRALAQGKTTGLSGLLLRQSIPVFIVAALIWAMRDQIGALDFAEIRHKLETIQPYQWCLALGATAVSFWAIGRYDEIVHGLLRTKVGTDVARTGGITAVAISQFAGFGALTASLVRWRMLPDISLFQSLRISAVVTVSFLIGWAFVTASAALIIGSTPPLLEHVAGLIVCSGIALILAPFFAPKWPAAFPTSAAMARIVFLVAVDVGFAALALFALLPTDVTLSLAPFILAFSVALLAGLMSGTPGGIGAFELCLLAQIPEMPADTLVAAALGFRLVYHVVPALLAAMMLIIGPKASGKAETNRVSYPRVPHLPPRLEAALWHAPFAEAKLVRQGIFGVLGQNRALVAELGQSLTALSAPLEPRQDQVDWFGAIQASAHRVSRAAGIYKAPPKTAVLARNLGWRALPIAREALVCTPDYATQGARHRQLRRMLRKAQTAGVTIEELGRDIPLDALEQISSEWADRNGGERTFSMGRFCADYIQYQRIFLARHAGKVTAFVTFHETRNQWTLDLMRNRQDTPPGTMHALVHSAITAAQQQRVPSVSLAACQYDGRYVHWLPQKIGRFAASLAGDNGLRRFKESFAPTWQTRYALAPSWTEMVLMMWDVALRVHGAGLLKSLIKIWKS